MLPPRTRALPLWARRRLLLPLLLLLVALQARQHPSLRARVRELQSRQQPPRRRLAKPRQRVRVLAPSAARQLPQVCPPPPPPQRGRALPLLPLRLPLLRLLLRVGLEGWSHRLRQPQRLLLLLLLPLRDRRPVRGRLPLLPPPSPPPLPPPPPPPPLLLPLLLLP